jgi:quercetin dioxygenase-like cupin family protein
MNNITPARYGIDPYLDWVAAEGVPVFDGIAVNLFHVETGPWARYGVNGAVVNLKGRGDFGNMMLFDIPPGGSTTPLKHLYEDVIYVLEGRGNTEVEFADGSKRSFEWGAKSLFAIPLNAKHRHFNASGQQRALLATTTNLPLLLNAFHNVDFVFKNDFNFAERVGSAEFFEGQGNLITVRQGNHMWETNFIPSLGDLELQAYGDRGPGSMNIKIVLADGSMHAHVSEMQAGTYKKGHRHDAGFHVMCVMGHGYSLAWYEGDKDFMRLDWDHGFVFPPADKQFHQHFTTSATPARYLATAVGGIRYPFTMANRRTYLGAKAGEKGASSTSMKDGGDQIEFEDQDPRIHPIWLAELRKNNLEPRMEIASQK